MKIWCMWVSKNSVNELMGPATQKQGILFITQDLGKIDKISSSQKQDPTMILQLMIKAYRHLVVAGHWSGLCIKPECWCHSVKTTCCLSCQDLWIFFDHSIQFAVVVSRKVSPENYVFGIFSSLLLRSILRNFPNGADKFQEIKHQKRNETSAGYTITDQTKQNSISTS